MMGKNKKEWQDADYVLAFYDRKHLTARRRYREYVEKGINGGRRWDLIGGGLARSAGGWSVVKAMRKGVDRILGMGSLLKAY